MRTRSRGLVMKVTEKAPIFCFSIRGLTEKPRPFTPNCIMCHVQTSPPKCEAITTQACWWCWTYCGNLTLAFRRKRKRVDSTHCQRCYLRDCRVCRQTLATPPCHTAVLDKLCRISRCWGCKYGPSTYTHTHTLIYNESRVHRYFSFSLLWMSATDKV